MAETRRTINRKGECDSCGFKDIETRQYTGRADIKGDTRWYCIVCASTLIGNAATYPEQHPNNDVLRSLGWCTNAILKLIRDSQSPGWIPGL